MGRPLATSTAPESAVSRKPLRRDPHLAQPKRLDAGAAVFEEGQITDRFFLLLDGFIRAIRVTLDGEQIIALHIQSGQLFGIAPALGHSHYPATAIAAADCVVLSWAASHWHDFVHRRFRRKVWQQTN